MYARVVRFDGVDREGIDRVLAQIDESDGPPPGVDARKMTMLWDESGQTSAFIAWFETKEAMQEAHRIFDSMDVGDTPGNRVSIDQAEVMIERDV